jgi:hypothetical protein
MKTKIIVFLISISTCSIYTVESSVFYKKTSMDSGAEEQTDKTGTKRSMDEQVGDKQEKNPDDVETLSRNNGHSGGYGALTFKGSKFKDTAILMMGLRGAWVVNRSLGLGIDLNGILPVSKYDDIDPEGKNYGILLGGYGGWLLEPVIWSNKIIHLTIPVSIGAGWLGYIEDWENNDYYYSGELYDQDVFWYIEPSLNAEINISRYFRVNAGVSKRFSQDLNLYNTPSDAFDKLNYTIVLKFGGF